MATSSKRKLEYQKAYNNRPSEVKKQSARRAARRLMIKQGRARVGDGKDVDHRDGNPRNNSASNLRITSRKFNRSRNNNK